MKKRVTLKSAQAFVRRYSMSIRKTSAGDYRVNFKGAPEVQAVYEATVQDALDTAMMMYNYAIRGAGKYKK